MDTWNLVIFVPAFLLLFSDVQAARPQLTLVPPTGTYMEGETVTLRCQVDSKGPLDIVRLERNLDGREYEISTNDYLRERFQQTGRYRLIRFDSSQGVVELKISDITGADAGEIGCKHLPSGDEASELISVRVPPKTLQMTYQATDGDHYHAVNGERIQLQQSKQTSLECLATVDHSRIYPEMNITAGAEDWTSRFQRQAKTEDGEEDGFMNAHTRVTYTMQVVAADTIKLHGKNVTCTATMPGFNPKSTMMTILVAQKPQLIECSGDMDGILGEQNFTISCRGRMHPAPHSVTWHWKTANGTNRIHNGDINNADLKGQYSSGTTQLRAGSHVFTLLIGQLNKHDFTNYHLEVVNELGTADTSFNLKQIYSPRQPTSTSAAEIEEDFGDTGALSNTIPAISPAKLFTVFSLAMTSYICGNGRYTNTLLSHSVS